mmetsp:Transcript_16415/g.39277  ORF Transcript_16415/g.39277 Transcript_16415/m.39277 type:complete len:461 (-) Transcript_16415:208-1590(-)
MHRMYLIRWRCLLVLVSFAVLVIFLFPVIVAAESPTPKSCDATKEYIDKGASWWPLQHDFQTQTVLIPDGNEQRTLTIEKLSSHPAVFRVKHFLSPEECETLRRLAIEGELQEGYVDSDDGLGVGGTKKRKMGIFDANQDGRLAIFEIIRMMDDYFESHLDEADTLEMLSHMGLVLDDEGTVSIQAFVQSNTAAMRRYVTQLIDVNPSKRQRHSEMAWIRNESARRADAQDGGHRAATLDQIQARVAALTGLPAHLVHGGMEMQVVHYKEPDGDVVGGGHYTAHFDSLAISPTLPCCHITGHVPPCRPCRLATVLYSLSDTDDGGETAFPFAGGDKEPHTAATVEDWRYSSESRQGSYCQKDGPGLRIKPELGQAILWFNHQIQCQEVTEALPCNPLLGELDRSTLHAGCPVQKNTEVETTTTPWNAPGKWIANHWIEASNVPGDDEEHYRQMVRTFVKG